MKIKLMTIKSIEDSLQKLMNKELNVRIAYRLAKVLKIITTELQEVEKARIELIRKYSDAPKQDGKSDPVSGQVQVAKEKEQEFFKEFNELLQEDVEIEFEPIDISELDDIKLSPLDLLKLTDFVIDKSQLPKTKS